MPRIQVWLKDADMEKLEDISKILAWDHNPDGVEEEDLEEYIKEGTVRRARRPKLNFSYVIRVAIEEYFFQHQSDYKSIAKRYSLSHK